MPLTVPVENTQVNDEHVYVPETDVPDWFNTSVIDALLPEVLLTVPRHVPLTLISVGFVGPLLQPGRNKVNATSAATRFLMNARIQHPLQFKRSLRHRTSPEVRKAAIKEWLKDSRPWRQEETVIDASL